MSTRHMIAMCTRSVRIVCRRSTCLSQRPYDRSMVLLWWCFGI
jgi:hypothetical protein